MRMLWAMGSILALIAVAAGAFGAHGLRARVEPRLLETFETAARYQMHHSLAILFAAWAAERGGSLALYAGWAFVVGILIFSGSLYLLTLTGARWLGAITPIGGVAFIVGWGLMALWGLRSA